MKNPAARESSFGMQEILRHNLTLRKFVLMLIAEKQNGSWALVMTFFKLFLLDSSSSSSSRFLC